MFQSGMQAINAQSSASQLKKTAKRGGVDVPAAAPKRDILLVDKNNTPIHASIVTPNNSVNQVGGTNKMQNSLPGGGPSTHIQKNSVNGGGVVSSSSNLIAISNPVMKNALLANALVFKEQVAHVQTSLQPAMISTGHVVKSLPTSIKSQPQRNKSPAELARIAAAAGITGSDLANTIQTQPAGNNNVKRGAGRPSRGRGATQAKRGVKKVLPNVDVKNVAEVQLSPQHHAPNAVSQQQQQQQHQQQQHVSAVKCTPSLSPAAVITVPPSPHTASICSTVDRCVEETAVAPNAYITPITPTPPPPPPVCLNSSTSPPPNITVSASNQLPQALVNQLALNDTAANSSKTLNPLNISLAQGHRAALGATRLVVSAHSVTAASTSAGGATIAETTTSAVSNSSLKVVSRPLRTMTPPSSNIHHGGIPSFPISQIDTNQPIMLVQLVTQTASGKASPTLTQVNSSIAVGTQHQQKQQQQQLQQQQQQQQHGLLHINDSVTSIHNSSVGGPKSNDPDLASTTNDPMLSDASIPTPNGGMLIIILLKIPRWFFSTNNILTKGPDIHAQPKCFSP